MLKTTIYKIESDNTDAQATIHEEGDCKNHLLVIARSSDLTAENRQTLSQMLNAIKYNLEDSCLFAVPEGQSTAINTAISKYDIKKVLCFGIAPKDIGMQIAAGAYRLIEMEGLNLVFSHTLTDLNADRQKKIKLWNAIQVL